MVIHPDFKTVTVTVIFGKSILKSNKTAGNNFDSSGAHLVPISDLVVRSSWSPNVYELDCSGLPFCRLQSIRRDEFSFWERGFYHGLLCGFFLWSPSSQICNGQIVGQPRINRIMTKCPTKLLKNGPKTFPKIAPRKTQILYLSGHHSLFPVHVLFPRRFLGVPSRVLFAKRTPRIHRITLMFTIHYLNSRANRSLITPITFTHWYPLQSREWWPLRVGSFLLTVELFSLQLTILAFELTIGAFLLTICLAFLLTVRAFLLAVGKCV